MLTVQQHRDLHGNSLNDNNKKVENNNKILKIKKQQMKRGNFLIKSRTST